MKILISINAFAVGGAQTFAIRLANSLANDHEVHIYEHEPWRRTPIRDLVSKQILIHCYQPKAWLNHLTARLDSLLRAIGLEPWVAGYLRGRHYRSVLKRVRPDVINSHVIGSDRRVVALSAGYPIVISMHGCYEDQFEKDENFRAEAERILDGTTAVIHAADKNKLIFDQINLDPRLLIKKIYYGYERLAENKYDGDCLGLDKNSFVFGMVARCIPSKGWKEAIESFILLERQTERNIEFVILCDENEYYEELKSKYQQNDFIHFVGFVNEPAPIIRKFDVGLLPTYFPGESLPNSIIEYLSEGKPVISTKMGEIENMITSPDGEAGILLNNHHLDSKDFIEELTRAMYQYVSKPELLEEHKAHSRLAFQKFSMKKCLKSYTDVFERATSL